MIWQSLLPINNSLRQLIPQPDCWLKKWIPVDICPAVGNHVVQSVALSAQCWWMQIQWPLECRWVHMWYGTHYQFKVGSPLVERYPPKVCDHLTGAAGGSVVPCHESCCTPLEGFQLLDVWFGVRVPWHRHLYQSLIALGLYVSWARLLFAFLDAVSVCAFQVKLSAMVTPSYCRFRNFRMIFIWRIFYFRIIREVWNLRASIHVVGHFRWLKLCMQIVVSQRSRVVVHRIAVHFRHADFN